MNKQRFIERLNLYLDQELPTDESEQLLAAIRENPEYHRIYLQYCQIFNASSQIRDVFAARRERVVWRQKAYAFGGMAAAVALLFLAAQNLSPLMTNQSGLAASGGASEAASSRMNDSGKTEPLLVAETTTAGRSADSALLARSLESVSFDVGQSFGSADSVESFAAQPLAIEFASLSSESKSREENTWQRSFAFGEPVQASTFAHEAVTAREAGSAFTASSAGSAQEGGEGEHRVRFDLNRTGAFGSQEDRR